MSDPLLTRNVKKLAVDGTDFYVRVWPLSDRKRFGDAIHAESKELVGLVLRLSVCDASGVLKYTDDDIAALNDAENGMLAQLLSNEALDLNALKVAAIDEAKKD